MPTLLACILALITTLPVSPPTEMPPTTSSVETPHAITPDADRPPPSTYDQAPKIPAEGIVPDREPFGLAQWARTVFALAIVLALIYLSKFALTHLTGLRSGGIENNLSVIERVQLDPKHALFIVDIKDSGRVLLGGGNGDLRLLANLDEPAAVAPQPPFSKTFSEHTAPTKDSPPPGVTQS